MGTPYEIRIDKITVEENGAVEIEKVKDVTKNGLILTLYYPSPGKPSIISTRTLKLQDGIEFDYSTKESKDAVVFKEEILDEAYLEIAVTSIEKATKLAKIFHKIFKSIIGASTALLPGGGIVTGAVKTGTDSVIDLLEPKDKTEIIGQYGGIIKEDNGNSSTVLPLQVPPKKDVVFYRHIFNDRGEQVYKEQTLIKGSPNGQIVISIKKL